MHFFPSQFSCVIYQQLGSFTRSLICKLELHRSTLPLPLHFSSVNTQEVLWHQENKDTFLPGNFPSCFHKEMCFLPYYSPCRFHRKLCFLTCYFLCRFHKKMCFLPCWFPCLFTKNCVSSRVTFLFVFTGYKSV